MRLKRTALRISEEMQALFRVVAMFTPAQYAIARMMTDQGNFTIAGVAKLMELSEQNVRQQLHRLRQEVLGRIGKRWWVPVRRKGLVRYGADEGEYQFVGREEVDEEWEPE